MHERDLQVLSVLAEWLDDVGHAPSLRELAAGSGLTSANGAMHAVRRLEVAGLVERIPRRPRGLTLTPAPRALLQGRSAATPESRRGAIEIAASFERAHLRSLGNLVGRTPALVSAERMLRLLATRRRASSASWRLPSLGRNAVVTASLEPNGRSCGPSPVDRPRAFVVSGPGSAT